MKTTFRRYDRDADYERVGRFLVRTYSTTGSHINWLQPRWEYMHYHPYVEGVDLNSIGIWEADGQIVGVVHPEHSMGTAYFEVDAEYGALKKAMLGYAERHLCVIKNGNKTLMIYVNDRDEAFQNLAIRVGYEKQSGYEAVSYLAIPNPPPEITLPDGFRLKSLAEDNDLAKLTRVIYRGFNHGDEPPNDYIEERTFMQSAPSYKKELNVVVEAPGGNFACYCGMWYEPVHRIAYVEPVCTDPGFRRMGLASATVLEGIRRCGERGATGAYVGSILPVYLSMGFRQIFNCSLWRREWA